LWAESKDILAYLKDLVERLDLGKHIQLNTQVSEARWDESTGKWRLKLQKVKPKQDWASRAPLEVLSEFEDDCDLLLHATGVLNRWDYPNIPGLQRFQGKLVHTAGWPDDLDQERWEGQRVAVIGSGASSIQVVTSMQV
jgi:hydroxyversicolorone monooxygenase